MPIGNELFAGFCADLRFEKSARFTEILYLFLTALTCTEVTDIHFRELSEREIGAYVATGEPMDKAGAYGIQGGAALFAEKMVGDYYNVMGLPVCRLWQLLRAAAPELLNA